MFSIYLLFCFFSSVPFLYLQAFMIFKPFLVFYFFFFRIFCTSIYHINLSDNNFCVLYDCLDICFFLLIIVPKDYYQQKNCRKEKVVYLY